MGWYGKISDLPMIYVWLIWIHHTHVDDEITLRYFFDTTIENHTLEWVNQQTKWPLINKYFNMLHMDINDMDINMDPMLAMVSLQNMDLI